MVVKSNVIAHYYYLVLCFLVLIFFSVGQFVSFSSEGVQLMRLIRALLIELCLITLFIWIVRHYHMVTISRDGFSILNKLQLSWNDVYSVSKFLLADIYFLRFKDKRFLFFVGDRLPFGIIGNIFQEALMSQLIEKIKKKYNI